METNWEVYVGVHPDDVWASSFWQQVTPEQAARYLDAGSLVRLAPPIESDNEIEDCHCLMA